MSGFTLTEIMIVSIIFGIIALSMTSLMVYLNSSLKTAHDSLNYRYLVLELINLLKNPLSLTYSAQNAKNTKFRECFLGSSNQCVHMQTLPFLAHSSVKSEAAVDSNGNPIMIAPVLGGIPGHDCDTTKLNSVYYDLNGKKCDCESDPVQCPIQSTTLFRPYCANGASHCSKASALELILELKLRDDIPTHLKSKSHFKSIPPTRYKFFFDLSLSSEYYIEFQKADAYDLIPNPPHPDIERLYQSLTSSQIRMGEGLAFRNPNAAKFLFRFNSPQPIKTIKVLRYVYPDECTIINIGNSKCPFPQDSDFQVLTELDAHEKTKDTFNFEDLLTVTMGKVIDYRLVAYNSANHPVLQNVFDLRAYYVNPGTVSVAPPINDGQAAVYIGCSSANPNNTFVFQAEADNGWSSLEALIRQEGTSAWIPFPGFNAFNPSLTTPQNIVIDSVHLSPNKIYEVLFKGTPNHGPIVTDRKSFRTLPGTTGEFKNWLEPASNQLRATSDIRVKFHFSLPCGENVASAKIRTENQDGSEITPWIDLTQSCDLTHNITNEYECNEIIPCGTWTGTAKRGKQCVEFPETQIYLRLVIIGSNQSRYEMFKGFGVTSKLFFQVNDSSVNFLAVSPAAVDIPKLSLSTLPIVVDLVNASNLLPSDSVNFKVTHLENGFSSLHTCKLGSGEASSYSDGKCTLNVSPPPLTAGILKIQILNDELYEMLPHRSTSQIEIIPASIFDCSLKKICPPGKTLKHIVRSHSNIQHDNATTYNLNPISKTRYQGGHLLKSSSSSIDFYAIVRPKTYSTYPANHSTIILDRPFGTGSYVARLRLRKRFNLCSYSDGCFQQLLHWPSRNHFDHELPNFSPTNTSNGIPRFNVGFNPTEGMGEWSQHATTSLLIMQECFCE
ncbi:MAG: prepilin-type N-terminal cleavage/methylation domain-containing protein [Bdellovibrionaceae bacterium]|nr:prepilin-type N-terminal cleavage/methylation domain-containing protein [Pseudobdellovibrionaceae bacterium]